MTHGQKDLYLRIRKGSFTPSHPIHLVSNVSVRLLVNSVTLEGNGL